MKKQILCVLLALLISLSGCAPVQSEESGEGQLTIVATTYPVYLFACAVTDGVEGVTVERLNTGETSCLHDYTLSVDDMKKLERADIIALNGVDLEEFMEDALASSNAVVIDCSELSEGSLLENMSHDHDEEDHDHSGHDHGHWDPHIWMDAMHADQMISCIRAALCELDPDHAEIYNDNAGNASNQLGQLDAELTKMFQLLEERGIEIPGLITFHDGFQYFAWAYGLPLLEAIEEEAGSEASAHEILEITELIKEYNIPVIFTETNGSDATAQAIARETGCQVAQLTMVMDGPNDDLNNYLDGLRSNAKAIVEGFAGEEVVS